METNLANQFLAKRTNGIRSSVIREILKITVQDSEFLSFAGGLPNPNLLDENLLLKATEETIRSYSRVAFQYGDSAGYESLRKRIQLEFLDFPVHSHSIFITHGSQQGLDLLGKLFLDENTNLLLEEPVYLGALQAFSPYRPNMIPLPMESDGPNLLELEKILSEEKIRCFYTNPSYQNPSTITWSLEKRKVVASLLDQYEVIIFEDEAYKYLDFKGVVYPSLSSFRERLDLTFVLGSFSKIISPGFRLGWVVVPELYQKIFTNAKQGNDLNTNQFSQVVMDLLLCSLDWKEHLSKIQSYYAKQKEHLVELLKFHLPEVRFEEPKGGMFLWTEYPNVTEKDMMEGIMDKKVVMVPGNEFRLVGKDSAFFRMNYSFLPSLEMEEGVKRIVSVYRDIIT
ncbi:PLP-dependent aminotransferase family protein [Leptospira levettii]|uniref:aminotransferase-like domain-containing protein n=1 Tax=Leptospira levettii TaxID=2023178 RepID=UPI00223CCC2C|nr:PLP-dependent aminotransferase family protein [Leptospira levettii]MCW7495868.1 PLP-dependent aminotransferase family protein [Leptospira levettii]